MNSINDLMKQLEALQPISSENQRRLDQKFMLEFNYNSNHMEGNTLTYGQTRLLLMFGETSGDAKLRDYEEMKAHNVGLELVKREAREKDRPLTESFIRELNRTILVENFYKTRESETGVNRYEVKVGQYKMYPNSVLTATDEIFEYASPEETPAMMTDLVEWYNVEEKKGELNPVELASLLHYRFIRIHPFDDGNGRIARLLVNFVFLRHNYPMVIVQSQDKENYLNVLHKCDIEVGFIPSDGAYAPLEEITPFVEYMEKLLEYALTITIRAAKGESIEEDDDWEKELKLKLQESKEIPLFSIEEAQKVQEESFFKLVSRIDNKLAKFEDLFDSTERVVYNAKNHSYILGRSVESINQIDKSYTYKNGILFISTYSKSVLYSKKIFSYQALCSFFERDYQIEISVGEEKLQIKRRYSQFLSEDILAECVRFVGKKLADFVKSNIIKDE